jgi:hypothetical protein
MTSEEWFRKMENLLAAMMEHHAKQQDEIDKHTQQIKEHSAESDKNTAAIKDLIVVSRTLLNSIQETGEARRKDREEWDARKKEWDARMKELSDRQAATDEKLHILIETVDRIIRNQQSAEQGGSGA